jgi:hypothetical protein
VVVCCWLRKGPKHQNPKPKTPIPQIEKINKTLISKLI